MRLMSWSRNRHATIVHVSRIFPKAVRSKPRLEALDDRTVPASLEVTTTLDVVDPSDGLLSLREAVLAANASQGASAIDVPPGIYVLTDGDLDLTSHVTVEGAGAGQTVIDGAGVDRIFAVASDSAPVTITGMT